MDTLQNGEHKPQCVVLYDVSQVQLVFSNELRIDKI